MVEEAPGRQQLHRPENGQEGPGPLSGQLPHHPQKEPGTAPEEPAEDQGKDEPPQTMIGGRNPGADQGLEGSGHPSHEGDRVKKVEALSQKKIASKPQESHRSMSQ